MAITINGSGTISGVSVGGLNDGIVDDGTLANDAVTLAKMASGTDGQIITYDASGNPSAVGPGTDGQVLTSTGAGSPPAFEAVSGVTDIKFLVEGTSANNVTGAGTTYTHIYGTEHFDTGNDFDGTSTFTAPETGKYLFCASLRYSGVTAVADGIDLQIITSNRNYLAGRINVNGISSQPWMMMSIVTEMDASDTAIVRSIGTGEASNVWDFVGDKTFFSGALLA